ncbi:MAG TPA: hypothetical protein VN886_14465, partial [Acidimicrobiales bacterium]|nr:hypothetical protein [Acidimicrobiales bacterium]
VVVVVVDLGVGAGFSTVVVVTRGLVVEVVTGELVVVVGSVADGDPLDHAARTSPVASTAPNTIVSPFQVRFVLRCRI